MLQDDVKLHVISFACQEQRFASNILETLLDTPTSTHKRRIFVDRVHTDVPAARPGQQRQHASSRQMQCIVKRIFLPAVALLVLGHVHKQRRKRHTLQA